jgi:hypothetical protein
MQQNIIRVIRKKRRLWKVYQRSKEYEEYLAYKRVEKEVRSLVTKAKKKFERKIAKEAKRKPKQFYSYIRSRTVNRQTVGPLKDEKGKILSDNQSMAGILNTFFTSVFTNETLPIPNPTEHHVEQPLLEVTFP